MPTVRTNGIETYYERQGDGPPVVFVHGAILDHAQWDDQMATLSDEYTTVAYDVRGHGRTGGSARRRYSIPLLADDLDALLRALDLERPVLCGLSMGGCIAQAFAATRPDRVSGLVLAGTFGPDLLSWRDWLQRSVQLRAIVPPVRLLGYERVERAVVRLQEQFSEGASGDYDEVLRLRESGPPVTTDEFVKVIRAVATFHRSGIDLAAITAPALVLYGEDEPPFIRQHASAFGDRLPEATVREVPGAGHVSNLDDPEFFSSAVRAFLDEIAAREEGVR